MLVVPLFLSQEAFSKESALYACEEELMTAMYEYKLSHLADVPEFRVSLRARIFDSGMDNIVSVTQLRTNSAFDKGVDYIYAECGQGLAYLYVASHGLFFKSNYHKYEFRMLNGMWVVGAVVSYRNAGNKWADMVGMGDRHEISYEIARAYLMRAIKNRILKNASLVKDYPSTGCEDMAMARSFSFISALMSPEFDAGLLPFSVRQKAIIDDAALQDLFEMRKRAFGHISVLRSYDAVCNEASETVTAEYAGFIYYMGSVVCGRLVVNTKFERSTDGYVMNWSDFNFDERASNYCSDLEYFGKTSAERARLALWRKLSDEMVYGYWEALHKSGRERRW